MKTRMLKFLLLMLAVCVDGMSGSVDAASRECVNGRSGRKYHCKHVMLQARVSLHKFPGKPRAASSLWGYVDPDDLREYAVVGLQNGTAVVEVTDPVRPRIVGHIEGAPSPWREVKVYSVRNKSTKRWDAYAYITTEGRGGGLQIIDLSELPDRISLAGTNRDIDTSHTLFISNIDYSTGRRIPGRIPRLYVNGSDQAGLVVFGLKNPRIPKQLGKYSATYVHDCYAQLFTDDRAGQCPTGGPKCEVLFAWTGSDFRILDVTKPASIQVVSNFAYPELGYAHSGWISSDQQFLFNFDELDEIQSDARTRIRTIDISDFRNPYISATFRGPEKSIEHNGIVIGNRLYVSHYTRGLVVMDTSDPEKLKEIAYFDTHPEDDGHEQVHAASHPGESANSFHGAWAVYPFLPSGNILISDIERGLFILRLQ